MNYQRHYDSLIARGQRTLIHGYRERHHIVPKCLGGTNKADNLVYLTAEEHYLAHQFLVKIYPGNRKLTFAAINMSRGAKRSNNKLYGWLRKAYSESLMGHSVSEATRNKIGDANRGRKLNTPAWSKGRTDLPPSWNKGISMSDNARKKQRDQKLGKPLHNQDTKKLIAEAGRNRPPISEATRQKMKDSWVIRKQQNVR